MSLWTIESLIVDKCDNKLLNGCNIAMIILGEAVEKIRLLIFTAVKTDYRGQWGQLVIILIKLQFFLLSLLSSHADNHFLWPNEGKNNVRQKLGMLQIFHFKIFQNVLLRNILLLRLKPIVSQLFCFISLPQS